MHRFAQIDIRSQWHHSNALGELATTVLRCQPRHFSHSRMMPAVVAVAESVVRRPNGTDVTQRPTSIRNAAGDHHRDNDIVAAVRFHRLRHVRRVVRISIVVTLQILETVDESDVNVEPIVVPTAIKLDTMMIFVIVVVVVATVPKMNNDDDNDRDNVTAALYVIVHIRVAVANDRVHRRWNEENGCDQQWWPPLSVEKMANAVRTRRHRRRLHRHPHRRTNRSF